MLALGDRLKVFADYEGNVEKLLKKKELFLPKNNLRLASLNRGRKSSKRAPNISPTPLSPH